MTRASDIDSLLGDTLQHAPVPRMRLRRKPAQKKRTVEPVPPLIAAWQAQQRVVRIGWLKRWASSQVAGYRFELIVGYLTMILFGWAAILAGIPVFSFTTPAGFAPIWGAGLMVFGLVAAIGAIRAGEEIVFADPSAPTPRELQRQRVVRVFNRIELTGTMALFLLLGTYAAILILIGNGLFDTAHLPADTATATQNLARIAVGCAIVALASHPTVRMVWLIFRPGKLMTPIATLVEAVVGIEHKVQDHTDPTGTVK